MLLYPNTQNELIGDPVAATYKVLYEKDDRKYIPEFAKLAANESDLFRPTLRARHIVALMECRQDCLLPDWQSVRPKTGAELLDLVVAIDAAVESIPHRFTATELRVASEACNYAGSILVAAGILWSVQIPDCLPSNLDGHGDFDLLPEG